MKSALLLAAFLALGPQSGAQPRFAGEFALPGVLCDCEPADFVFRTSRPLDGHETPDAGSPVIRRVDAGRLIEGNDWNEALTVVTRAGRAVARRDVTLTELNHYGDARYVEWSEEELPTVDIAVPAGGTIEYLTADQGYVWFRHAGVLYGGFDPLASGAFAVESRPAEAVWFHLVPRSGRPAAWVEIRFGERAGANVEMICETHGGCVEPE